MPARRSILLRAPEQLSTLWTGTHASRNGLLPREGRAIAPSTMWTAACTIIQRVQRAMYAHEEPLTKNPQSRRKNASNRADTCQCPGLVHASEPARRISGDYVASDAASTPAETRRSRRVKIGRRSWVNFGRRLTCGSVCPSAHSPYASPEGVPSPSARARRFASFRAARLASSVRARASIDITTSGRSLPNRLT